MNTTLTSFEYEPGGKWDCGSLNIKADTPLGPFVWDEVIPGPRHSEDSCELTATLNGVEIDIYDGEVGELDFEPPCEAGRWADQFAASEGDVAQNLEAWYEASEEALKKLVA